MKKYILLILAFFIIGALITPTNAQEKKNKFSTDVYNIIEK